MFGRYPMSRVNFSTPEYDRGEDGSYKPRYDIGRADRAAVEGGGTAPLACWKCIPAVTAITAATASPTMFTTTRHRCTFIRSLLPRPCARSCDAMTAPFP